MPPLFRTITLGTASDYSDRMGSDRTASTLRQAQGVKFKLGEGSNRDEKFILSLSKEITVYPEVLKGARTYCF